MVDLFGQSILDVPYYYAVEHKLDDLDVVVSRTGYTSELGYEIYVLEASRYAERLWDAVLEAGRPHDLAVIGPCHIRRIEGGMLAYGADMTLENNPYEVGMGYGDSLGAYNDGSMVDFFPVHHRGERVGRVTSACHSPRLEKHIGYAMLPVALAELGTELQVDVTGDLREALVVAMPFIDPKKETAKQRLTAPRR
jgi:glycine cleavage system aminomethyltransferase T